MAKSLEESHHKADLLPKSRKAVLDMIKAASGIDDHDLAKSDVAYADWKDKGRKGPKPKRNVGKGGELDSFSQDLKRGRHFSSLLEAFEVATKGAQTWRDITPVIDSLREVPGFANAHLPEDALLRHAIQDQEREDFGDTSIDIGDTSFHFGAARTPKVALAEVVAAIRIMEADDATDEAKDEAVELLTEVSEAVMVKAYLLIIQ